MICKNEVRFSLLTGFQNLEPGGVFTACKRVRDLWLMAWAVVE
jgi:hypothetical protein